MVAVVIRADSHRGFTLIELLFVIIIVGILTVMAVPQIGAQSDDRLVYDDASAIAQLFRMARGRAMARGSAVIVELTTSGSRGTFNVYETVETVAGAGAMPSNNCRGGQLVLPDANHLLIDGVRLDGARRAQAAVESSILSPAGTTPTTAFACIKPSGTILWEESGAPNFDNTTPLVGAFAVALSRRPGGVTTGRTRTVVVPPNSLARVISR